MPQADKKIDELIGYPNTNILEADQQRTFGESLMQNHIILYIEDNAANISLMKSVFESVPNTELQIANNAEEGLEVAQQIKPDLILMDIQLPGMDGIEATKGLRMIDETRNIPVIAISAAAMKNDVERAKEAQFHSYITKPINVTDTLRIINEALSEKND